MAGKGYTRTHPSIFMVGHVPERNEGHCRFLWRALTWYLVLTGHDAPHCPHEVRQVEANGAQRQVGVSQCLQGARTTSGGEQPLTVKGLTHPQLFVKNGIESSNVFNLTEGVHCRQENNKGACTGRIPSRWGWMASDTPIAGEACSSSSSCLLKKRGSVSRCGSTSAEQQNKTHHTNCSRNATSPI